MIRFSSAISNFARLTIDAAGVGTNEAVMTDLKGLLGHRANVDPDPQRIVSLDDIAELLNRVVCLRIA